MPKPVRVAIAGLGRMGRVHALHLQELAGESRKCEFAALADVEVGRARRFCDEIGHSVPIFQSVEELASAGVCDATVVVTPTKDHQQHASLLVEAGQRVLLEKPLTPDVISARSFAAKLDQGAPHALMLGFQRRFDEPLRYAKELTNHGVVGKVFKVYSALEDSNPAPDGFKSGGILPDLAIHNVDEVLWLTGRKPVRALGIGSRLYSHALTTAQEDFDDALLCLWFDDNSAAQVQVSRNHVSGYRNETVIFGENGQIHVGRFEQNPSEVVVEAYGRSGRTEPIARRLFNMRQYRRRDLPEFVDRYGPAYKSELAAFIDCCATGAPFPTNHRDGLYAQEVIAAAMQRIVTAEQAAPVRI